MKKGQKCSSDKSRGLSLFISIILVFMILGAVVLYVERKADSEMSSAAIQNLNESLDLVQCTIEAILNKEAEFQKLIATELSVWDNPEEYVRSYQRNQTMAKLAFIPAGKSEGVANSGEPFTEEKLDFPENWAIGGLAVSTSYMNYMGSWAYTIKSPVVKDGEDIGILYIEYTFDSLDKSLPYGFYNNEAMLYIMDAKTKRFVLKPKGMGERSAGHINLEDYYRANDITEQELLDEVEKCVKSGENLMFYHDIRGGSALNYMWTVNGGTLFLTGYVPIEAIQREGKAVSQSIFIVVAVMLAAFMLCCVLYYFNHRQQNRLRAEREAERELHNRQLAEALQAAQLASSSKTTFLSNMSHDIRTPMNAVLGFTTLLERDAGNPEKVREYTKKITASGQHLLSLINDVLDVSKIESGKVVLNLAEFALNDMVSSIDAIIRPMAAARSQKFTVEVKDIKHEYLIGDETRINQVLINLLSNAVKYTPEGGNISLRIIGLRQRSSQFEHIRIEVEDNGYGMTPEYLKTVFDAFTRAENSTTNKVQGTGLGMAITKNIVELMGGTIEVSSEVNKGTVFKVDWEFRIPEGQRDRQFWEDVGISRILAVTENPGDRSSISALTRDMGISVDFAASGEAAVMMARSGEYQMALLDWDDSELGCAVAAEGLREALPEGGPLLLMVSQSDNESAQDAAMLQNTGILVKPFFLAALKNKVDEILRSTENRAENSDPAGNDSLAGLHFLAAEDNEINAEILTEILDMEGASCVIAENGRLALERFESSHEGEFDAILMDVQMPVMNGYDATRAIRALSRPDAAAIPIIAMTANAFAEDECEALSSGMNVHIAKPIDISLLKKVIRQYTDNRTGSSSN